MNVITLFKSLTTLGLKPFAQLLLVFSLSTLTYADTSTPADITPDKKLAYLVSDHRIPYWEIMGRGIKTKAEKLGYDVEIFSANNLTQLELENTINVIKEKVTGIIVSPTSSSTCVTILRLAKQAGIPVVISDIGTEEGDYVSFIGSDNYTGAYDIALVLIQKLQDLGWEDGHVGIIAIPQTRVNGQARTSGFLKALDDANIKGAGIFQQVDFSYQETYDHTMALIKQDPQLRAVFLQGSDRYEGALDAIKDANKSGQIIVICFDAEPIFLDLIPQGDLVGAAMQQPYLMGIKAVEVLNDHLEGKSVQKFYQLPVLAVSAKTIEQQKSVIKRNVLGILSDE